MELSNYSQDGSITLYFLIPFQFKADECSKLLKCAFQACKEHELGPVWLTHEECLRMIPSKQDVLVCDPFEGEAFDHLLSGAFKCVVLGPRCLLTCLHSKKPVPELPSPLHNMAMHEIVLTSTGFEKEEKTHIQRLVEKMCGIYSNSFHEGVTHLIAKAVGTKKYLVAVEKEIPIMTENWVDAVWKLSNEESDENVSATHEQFVKYTCPVFRGLTICVSQMPRKEKDAIKAVIEKNGGTYAANLEMSVTSILITPSTEGEKYKHAMQWRIPCLKQDWIYDSVECGFALPWDEYKLQKKPKSSTPTNDQTLRGPPNISLCSTIAIDNCNNDTANVNETVEHEISILFKKNVDPRIAAGVAMLDELDFQKMIKSGQFLDGCKVFASGFEPYLNEKLRRIFNTGGAIRFNNLSEAVTHIVIGKHVDEHMNAIKEWNVKPSVVTAEWLVECVKSGKVVEEEKFLYLNSESVERSNSPLPPPSFTPIVKVVEKSMEENDETFVDEELMKQYLTNKRKSDVKSNSFSEKSMDSSTLPDTQQSTTYDGMFKGLTFTVSGYSEDIEEQLTDLICENGGEVAKLNTTKTVNFSIVSLDGEGVFVPKALNYITHIYLEDCFEQETLMPVEYYHMPFVWSSNSALLRGCVLATSAYKGKERAYITNMASSMGALSQEMFARKDNMSKGVRASTHLLCPTPEGSKFTAAQKWGVPAITKDWIFACAEKGFKVQEEPFLVDKNSEVLDGKQVLLSLLKKAGKVSDDISSLSMVHSQSSQLVHKRVRSIQDDEPPSDQIKTPDIETIRKMYPTPCVRAANDSIDAMPTPDTPYGTTWYKDPPPRIRKGIKRMLDSIPDNVPSKRVFTPTTPEEVILKRYNEKLKGIVSNYTFPKPPSFDEENENPPKSVAVEPEPNKDTMKDKPADHHGPLTGVVVYSSRKLSDSQQDLYKAVAELGGDYRWTYDSSVTHFLHYGRMNDTNKEFRLAREEGKRIVAPDWVWMCRDEGRRIEEELFPHVHNPKLSLSIISRKNTSIRGKKRGRKRVTDVVMESQVEGEDDESEDEEEEDEEENEANKTANLGKKPGAADISNELLAKELEELETLAAVNVVGQRKTPNTSARKALTVDKIRNTPTRPISTQQRIGNTETESQSTAITWDDPQEREARARLEVAIVEDTEEILAKNEARKLEKGKENNSPRELNITSSLSALSETSLSSSNYVFALSGMTDEDREMYTDIIICLGGSVMDKTFDMSITHVVTLKPNRSEKHLAAIASGKWILYNSYLDCSRREKRFVDEVVHEWGNPEARSLPSLSKDSTEGKLAFAAHRWRLRLSDSGNGAFYNMRAIFYSSKERVAAFTRLVEAGGGQVIKNNDDIERVTHCFVEIAKAPKTDLALFAAKGIPCLPPMYLNDYLINYPPPDEMECCIQEYKNIIENMT